MGVTADLAGRICLVTGASNGLGEATALALAALGARVILICRDAARGARALEDVKRRTGNGGVELVLADLGSLASIERAAHLVAARHRRLDVLVNNAGLVTLRRTLTADGFEATFGVNHLGSFALTNRLLPLLRAGAPSRVVNVSSDAHRGVVLDFDDLQGERHYSFWTAYRRSKLANILFTAELARRLSGSGVTANALHPGAVRTGLGDRDHASHAPPEGVDVRHAQARMPGGHEQEDEDVPWGGDRLDGDVRRGAQHDEQDIAEP